MSLRDSKLLRSVRRALEKAQNGVLVTQDSLCETEKSMT